MLNRVQNGESLYEEVPKELYDKIRTSYNNKDSKYANWEYGNVGFLASYNGRFFEGGYAKAGYEKTKNGKTRYRDYYRESKDNILSQNLFNIELDVKDYKEYNPTNALIYCDPPYQNTKQFSNSDKFDFNEFWNVVRKWTVNNIVLVSELNAPNDFKCIWEKPVSRSIKSKDKSVATEKLFTLNNMNKTNKQLF